jgi:Cys-rich four helix bundle protein (predicted Tat secretion target)
VLTLLNSILDSNSGEFMERRKALHVSTVAMGAAAIAASLNSKQAIAEEKGGTKKETKNKNANTDLLAECINSCEVCIAHCQYLLSKGDTSLSDCLKKCLEVIPLCEATKTLSNYKSKLTSSTAKICMEACKACAQSCKPHIGHHEECKQCFESCQKCIECGEGM